MYLARYAGLRIHEYFRIDTATAERALRENAITIKGKGGKVRTVLINEQITIAMRKQLERTPRGHKPLVPDDMPTDRAINHLQFFIMRYRDEVRDADSDRPITFHGLRHTNASIMLSIGITTKLAMARGGWTNEATLQNVYQHVFNSDKQIADEKINEYFKALAPDT